MTSNNPFNRPATEQAAFERMVYLDTPAPHTLQNKLGIKDASELDSVEQLIVAQRAAQGLPDEARQFTYEGFKAIHRHLFQDVYDWAGQEREYTTGRGPTPFARPEFIASYMKQQFRSLEAKDNLRGLNKADFVTQAADLISEINAAHPFVDGNGRTQRTWLRLVAERAGFRLILKAEDRQRWNDASRTSFEESDNSAMAKLLSERLSSRERSKMVDQSREAKSRDDDWRER